MHGQKMPRTVRETVVDECLQKTFLAGGLL